MLRKLSLTALLLVAVLGVAIVLAGCGQSSANKLVGTWKPQSNAAMTWTFGGDGSFTQKRTATGGLPDATGKYTLDGKNLSMSLNVNGQTATTSATVDFVSDSQIKVQLGGMGALTFDRVK